MALSYGFCLGSTSSTYDSAQFSAAFHALVGDGVCPYGDRLSLTLDGSFTVKVGTGYALVQGRWFKVEDEPVSLTLPVASNTADRWDAVAARVDLGTKAVTLEVLPDADPAAPPADCMYLYLIYVKRGATVLYADDVTDKRIYITPLSELSGDALYVYRFLTSGIDQEVDRLIGLSNAVIDRADAAIKDLDAAIASARGIAIGDTMTAKTHPLPTMEWLPCDGSAVPAQYPDLIAAIGPILPRLTAWDPRFSVWMHAGEPA